MSRSGITNAQFLAAQDKIDAMTRKTRRGTVGTEEELAVYSRITTEWEAACGLLQQTYSQIQARDAVLLEIATRNGLL